MTWYANEAVTYAPLYIHSFWLVQPRTLVEAEKFNIRYTDPTQVERITDKLRWFRCNGQGNQIKDMRMRRNMTQAEFARRLGVPLGTLKAWEQDRVQISKSAWEKLKNRG